MSHRWLFLFLALPLFADDKPKPAEPLSIDIEKPKAHYALYVPEGYTADHSWPLLVTLYGAKQTAETNVKLYMDAAKKAAYLVASPKARGESWEDSDADIILAVLEDVKKKYSIDPDQVCLAGAGKGALVATKWGLAHADAWRCIFAHGGAIVPGDLKAGQVKVSILFSYGDKDQNVSFIKKAEDLADKAKLDWQEHVYKDMDQYSVKAEIWENAFAFFADRMNKPEEVLARGKKAKEAKRWHDAILALKSIADAKGKGSAKDADTELAAIDKAGMDLIAAAVKKGEKDKKGAKADLDAIVSQFDGCACAEKAKKAEEDLDKKDSGKEPPKDKGK